MDLSKNLGITEIRNQVNSSLVTFVQLENQYLRAIGPELNPVADALERFMLDSGKRLRPIFAYVGLLGTGTSPNSEFIAAVSSLELVHVCALMHDDVMDASDTRRGAPSIHRAFEARHLKEGLTGSAAQFGLSSAILLGDLALIWASKMLHQSGIKSEDLIRALPVYDEMRVELMAGQYLDVYEQALATQSVERAMRVARYKSAKYTIERPLHFGAQLGSVPSRNIENIIAKYSGYGLPLGEAFQLRDDVLGVFGDPIETGKPAGDDLREGKRTVLMAATIERATDSAKSKIEKLFADPDLDDDGVAILRSIIVESGALNQIEDLIESLTIAALTAIRSDLIDPIAQKLLHELVAVATARKV